MVESQPSKLLVAGSIPVSRSKVEAFCGRERAGVEKREPAAEIPSAFCEGSVGKGLMRAKFEQGVIKVEREREFGGLKAALEKAFAADRVTRYLKELDRRKIRVRDLDAAFAAGAIDAAAGEKAGTARSLYGALPVSDQAQMRELYLSKIEEVDPALRAKFHELYQYY